MCETLPEGGRSLASCAAEAHRFPDQAPKKGRPMTKAEFIRNYPDMSTRDVVAKAKEAGISISEDYVYKLRSFDRKVKSSAPSSQPAAAETPEVVATDTAAEPAAAPAPAAAAPVKRTRRARTPKQAKPATKRAPAKAAKAPKVAAKRGRKAAAKQAPASSNTGLEQQFASIALDLGLARAEWLLSSLRARLTAFAL